ncbi:MAG: hypothetical protein FJ190_10905 [Gammaproteobacteria bacterium]|nr:hypothetical protein [Gammaproteobacteria bacterium]
MAKFYSDWIDEFRDEVSKFASNVTTISLLWNTEILDKNEAKMSNAEFIDFRNNHKDMYRDVFDSYSSLMLRFRDNNSEDIALKKVLEETISHFTGNNATCGFKSQEKINEIIKYADEIVVRERNHIESNLPNQSNRAFSDFIIPSFFALIVTIAILLLIFWT